MNINLAGRAIIHDDDPVVRANLRQDGRQLSAKKSAAIERGDANTYTHSAFKNMPRRRVGGIQTACGGKESQQLRERK